MSLARRLATRGYTSMGLRNIRRAGHRLAPVAGRGTRRARFFWQVGDPYAAVALPYLAAIAEARRRAGHYLGSVTTFEGEHYWSVDRLHYLEARLGGSGYCPRLDPVMPGAPLAPAPVPLDVFLSLRSPYSLIATERIELLADHYGAALRVRFVLPMVMRGLPVPAAKRGYITLDTKREAERHGIAFGTIIDLVGAGVERGLALLHASIGAGGAAAGLRVARALLQAAFAQGIDLTGDALFQVAAAQGYDRSFVTAALANSGWRAVAEANSAALFGLGLWGVPSFRFGDRAAHWGQDRLWAVGDDLRSERGLAPIDRRVPCVG